MVERNIGKVCFLTKAHKLMLSCLKHRFGIISFFLLRHVLSQSEPHNAVGGGLELCVAGVSECKWS